MNSFTFSVLTRSGTYVDLVRGYSTACAGIVAHRVLKEDQRSKGWNLSHFASGREELDGDRVVAWDSAADLREAEQRRFHEREVYAVLESKWVRLRQARECGGCHAHLQSGDPARVSVTRDGGGFSRLYLGMCCTGGAETAARGEWTSSDLEWRAELPGMGSGSPDAL